MLRLNERGAILSGVFYGILLLFLFLVLGIVMVLGNGRLSLDQAKETIKNELNSKSILLEGVTLDDKNSDGGKYFTNDVTKSLLDITVTLKNEDVTSDTKTTILVTVYNSTKYTYMFRGLKYNNFTEEEIESYPKLENYVNNDKVVIDESSYNSLINTTIDPYGSITIPLSFKYSDINDISVNDIRAYILFDFIR